ncbi:hypothetical protein PRZ48_002683 [Zasmidium cellare]|uniref:SnoaL-like domain-containing protein n=1 Tax=Zasmidium cellare TaxID=395010 RepID=A0ABR0ESX8_ZASCE|nr:hypothetical protein PRZ48_002683 [Zasmidium cellare]
MPVPHTTSKRFKPIGTIALGPAVSKTECTHDSLALLSPDSLIPTAQHTEDALTGFDATALYIADLSEQILRLIYNERDFNHPLLHKHICPTLSSTHDPDPDFPKKSHTDLDSHVAEWVQTLKANPTFDVQVLDTVAEVHEKGRRARTWSVKRVVGLPGGLCKESVSCGKWERRGGTWVITSISMLRGVTEFA